MKLGSLPNGISLELVEVLRVDPAWTPRLGLLKYRRGCRLGTHQAAAQVIGCRGLGFGERLPWLQSGRRRIERSARVGPTPVAGAGACSPMGDPDPVEVSLRLAGPECR